MSCEIPECHPVQLDWNKHRVQRKDDSSVLLPLPSGPTPSTNPAPPTVVTVRFKFSQLKPAAITKLQMLSQGRMEPPDKIETSKTPPLLLQSSSRCAHTGPIKTGGQVFFLDHKRWTSPMKEAIYGLLVKYHGQKDTFKLVDQDYVAMVHRSATNPNSLLHPTTKYHITQYIKHQAKELNASSSLNTSPEKPLETQKLWQSLTEGVLMSQL